MWAEDNKERMWWIRVIPGAIGLLPYLLFYLFRTIYHDVLKKLFMKMYKNDVVWRDDVIVMLQLENSQLHQKLREHKVGKTSTETKFVSQKVIQEVSDAGSRPMVYRASEQSNASASSIYHQLRAEMYRKLIERGNGNRSYA